MALGEIALESGDFAAARAYWERIMPAEEGLGSGFTDSASASHKSEIGNQKSTSPMALLSRHEARSGRSPGTARAGVDSGRGRTPGTSRNWRARPAAPRRPRPAGRPQGKLRPISGNLLAEAPPGPPPPPIPAGPPSPAIRNATRSPRRSWTWARSCGGSRSRSARFGRPTRRPPRGTVGERPRRTNRVFIPLLVGDLCWSTIRRRFSRCGCDRASRPGASRPPSTSPNWPARRALPCSLRHAGNAAVHDDRRRQPALRPDGPAADRPTPGPDAERARAIWSAWTWRPRAGCSGKSRRKRAGRWKARRWPTGRASTWPCAAATSGRRPPWPVSTPTRAGSAGGGSSAARRRPPAACCPSVRTICSPWPAECSITTRISARWRRFGPTTAGNLAQPLSPRAGAT